MRSYRVSWAIDVDAENALEAAAGVQTEYFQPSNGLANVFVVENEDGNVQEIDLTLRYGLCPSCEQPRPYGEHSVTFDVGSECPHCGHVEVPKHEGD